MDAVNERYYRLWSRGDWSDFNCTVERTFQSTVRAELPAKWPGGGTELFRDAELVPEGSAIAFRLAGRTIGYLDQELAAAWAEVVRRVAASGFLAVVPCRLYVYEHDSFTGKNTTGRIELALGKPQEAVPRNDPPGVPYTLLPKSSVVQVTKEDQHFDILHDLLPGGRAVFIATLHERPAPGRSNPLVEVRINDQVVGQLTPQMSQRYLPLIRHLFDKRGLVAACWSDVTSSAVAAEVRIAAVKAEEATAELLDGPPVMVPLLVPSRASASEYDLGATAGLLEPRPALPPPPMLAEPPESATIRFVMGRRYMFVAQRRNGGWLTSASDDENPVKQLMVWDQLGRIVTAFDYATATDWVNLRGDERIREKGAVICFALAAGSQRLDSFAAINIADDRSWDGDWYTTCTDNDDVWSPFGHSATFSDIASLSGQVSVVTAWSRFELPG